MTRSACWKAATEGGQILIRLRDNETWSGNFGPTPRPRSTCKTKSDSGLPEPTKRILRDNAEENRQRRERLGRCCRRCSSKPDYFVAGQPLEIEGHRPLVLPWMRPWNTSSPTRSPRWGTSST